MPRGFRNKDGSQLGFQEGQKMPPRGDRWRRRQSIAQKGKRMGSLSHAWKGGKIMSNGYIEIYKRDHPHNNGSYVKEHRFIMEQHLGRFLEPQERVHHINGIKTDNRIVNLLLLKNESVHNSKHPKRRNRVGQFIN